MRVETTASVGRVSIADQGVGMSPEAQSRVFERFERAVEFRKVSGLGLGLYIVREIVGAHGGSVSLVSCEGQGTTFAFTLPLWLPPTA